MLKNRRVWGWIKPCRVTWGSCESSEPRGCNKCSVSVSSSAFDRAETKLNALEKRKHGNGVREKIRVASPSENYFLYVRIEIHLIPSCWSLCLTLPLGWMNCNSESLCVRRSESEPECLHSGGNDLHVSIGQTQRGSRTIQLLRLLHVISPKTAKIWLFGMFGLQKWQIGKSNGGALGVVGPTVLPSTFWVFHKRGIKEKACSEEARTETRVGRVWGFGCQDEEIPTEITGWLGSRCYWRRLHKVESQPGTLPFCSAPNRHALYLSKRGARVK